MKIAKKWLAVLIAVMLACSAVSIGIAVNAKLPTEADLPINYELYDYYKDINTAINDKTTVKSDSPWSVGIKIGDIWTAPNEFSTTYRRSYVSGANSAAKIDYFPGFSYYYPNNYTEGSPLYHSMLSPSNVSGNDGHKIDTAYIFEAPLNGTYTLGKADQSLIYSAEKSNFFAQEKQKASLPDLDFGVRITVNDVTIWPAASESFYKDGWAVFGNKDAKVSSIEIPTINGIELAKGDIVKVEATALTPVAVTSVKAQRITGCVKMSLTVLGENEESNIELKDRYELYDYFGAVVDAYENGGEIMSTSPWSVQCHFDDKWNAPDRISIDGNYLYVGCSGRPDWGVAYPGFGFYNNPDVVRNQLALISPAHSAADQSYVGNSSYTFVAPEKGTYTFHYSDPDKAAAFADTQFFSPRTLAYTGITFGVRITLNDEVIWPDNSYKGPTEDDFVQFGYELRGLPGLIAIPKLENLGMMKNDVLRVEFTSFTGISGEPWNQFIKGCVSMTKTSSEVIVDEEVPVFGEGIISLQEAGGSYLKLIWPEASDNISSSDKLTYELFISKEPYTAGVLPTTKDGHSVNSTGGLVMDLEPETTYYAAVVVSDVNRNKSVLVGGPFSTKEGQSGGEGVFEVYDYLDEITDMIMFDQQTVAIEETESPWVAQIYDNGWKNLNRATRLGDLVYCNITSPEWGGYYPGMSYYAPQKAQLNRYLARLNPAKAAASVNSKFDYCSAYTFTAPYAGKYTFEKGNSDYAYADIFDGYFAVADSGSKNLSMGVRITLNDEVIWPLENTECNLQDGWAVVVNHGTPEGSVEIPTFENIEMIAGDVLRVETKAFDGTTNSPWYQQVSACVRMVMTEKTVDEEPPVFAAGEIKSTAKTTTSLTITWPLAEDALSNSDSIKYKMYYSESPVTEENMGSLESINLKGNTQRLTLLKSDTDYYVAIVATDISGNSATIFGGPFRTQSKSGGNSSDEDNSGGVAEIPDSPLGANQSESDCGIVSSGGGSVTLGWVNSGNMSYYMAYLFDGSGSSAKLVKASDTLGGNTSRYTFDDLSNGTYTAQIVGYNNRGEAFEIFVPITFSNAASSTVVDGNNKPQSPGGLNGVVSQGQSQGKDVTTYITEEGVTQVQDVYETVTNTRTITNGPSVLEQILWIVLLVVGGILLLASLFLLWLLLKKDKKSAASAK